MSYSNAVHQVKEIAGRLRRPQTLLGHIFGLMVPSLCGCRTPYARSRGLGWDKHLPSPMRGALPQRSWVQWRRRVGLAGWGPLWRHGQAKSPAPLSRWPWPWVVEDAVVNKDGRQLG